MLSEQHLQKSSESQPHHFGFLLQPNFTLLALSSALEPLRMANQLSGKQLYSWTMISENGLAVTASDNITVNVDCAINNNRYFDTVLVCGGLAIKDTITKTTLSWLACLSRRKITLGGICTGSYLLAKAGLLNGYNCTIHWERLAGWQEDFPYINSCNQLFMIDRDRITSSGGTAPMDMMLNLIGMTHGKVLRTNICDMFSHDHVRDESDQQRVPLQHIVGANQSKLQDVVSLMEANIEEPLCLDELACYAHLSRRQLERLFQKYLKCTPHRYYIQLRLTRARQLLRQTNMTIIEVGIACGFVSTPHFSKCYRNSYKIPPRDERTLNDPNMRTTAASGESSFGSSLVS
ncbi:MAG: GlxA family transcriptional regulator [Alteromonadaceae bacterium]|nr:GlxA family transcriptional regulator [Alteromonadaceae bacterium]